MTQHEIPPVPEGFVPVLDNPRFVESSPQLSEELSRLSATLIESKSTRPKIAGATIFGSAIKGSATEVSDFDICVFINMDDNSGNQLPLQTDEQDEIMFEPTSPLIQDYRDQLCDYLSMQTEIAKERFTDGVKLFPISDQIIEQELNEYFSTNSRHYEQRDKQRAWQESDDFDSEPPPEAPFAFMPLNISALFKIDLSPGLSGYRKKVIEKLKSFDSVGEVGWQDILLSVLFGEGHIDDENYPQSLDDAQKEYC